MSSYFTLPSFARAKKNQEDLKKANPQTPILNDEDEKFLERELSKDGQAKIAKDAQPVKVSDEGTEQAASEEERNAAGTGAGQVVIPETQPTEVERAPQTAETQQSVPSPASAKKPKKTKAFELPSQEEAEKATQGWEANKTEPRAGQPQDEKRTWASYIPSIKPGAKKEGSAFETTDGGDKSDSTKNQDEQRTWTQFASSYVPSSIPTLPDSWTPKFGSKDKDAKAEPVYNEDGSINEEKTKEKQEKEVSVLLDKLDMSSFNNRVFALSAETQKFYDRFAQVLKDTMNGGPTAYEDMEKLMRDAGPHLEKQFQSMPPFVQTLVKSLPAKLGTTLGPELIAAASEKPGNDMKVKLEASKKPGSGSGTTTPTTSKAPAKSKRRVPGLKGLVSQEGAIAAMLRNVVNFLRVRFPLLASTTNVVMSLAVFILMFVFWYCHKRGKEVRLARAAEAKEVREGGEAEEVEDDDEDYEEEEEDDEEEDENGTGEEEKGGDGEAVEEAKEADTSESAESQAQKTLNQSEPAEVPLPAEENEKA